MPFSPLPESDSSPALVDATSERLASALSSSQHVAFDWNIATDRLHLTASPGFDPADVIPAWSPAELPSLIHPDDRAAFRDALTRALKGGDGDPASGVYLRLRDRAGAWCRVALVGRVVERDGEGRALRMRGHVGQPDMRAPYPPVRAEPLFRRLVDLSPDAIVLCRRGRLVLVNRAAQQLFGARQASQLLGRRVSEFIAPSSRAGTVLRWDGRVDASTLPKVFEERWVRIDGSSFEAEIAAGLVCHEGTTLLQLTLRDITERRRLQALQRSQARILSMIAVGSSLTDILDEIVGVAESYAEGGRCVVVRRDGKAEPQTASSAAPRDASYAAPSAADVARVPALATTTLATPIRGRNKTPYGTLRLHFDSNALPDALVMQALDICASLAGLAIESRASEEDMRRRAHYDGLTGLPNRFLFREYLDLALRSASRHGGKFAVLFIDLDKFKDVNDGYGHDEGDAVLKEISSRFRTCLRQSDRIARMGGDEFYVLIDMLEDSRHAADVAQKLLGAASRPVKVGCNEHRLSASIGIGIYPEDGQDADTLLKRADAAMYSAKNKGKNGFDFFTRPKLSIVRSHAPACTGSHGDTAPMAGNK